MPAKPDTLAAARKAVWCRLLWLLVVQGEVKERALEHPVERLPLLGPRRAERHLETHLVDGAQGLMQRAGGVDIIAWIPALARPALASAPLQLPREGARHRLAPPLLQSILEWVRGGAGRDRSSL